MAHNAYVRGSTTASWPLGTTISPDHMAAFDRAQYTSVNGDDGGEWEPTDAITIGGAGVTLTSTLTAAELTAVTTTISGVLTGATVAFQGLVELGTTTSGAVYSYAPTTFTNTVDFNGVTVHAHGVAVSFYGGSFESTGTTTISGTTTVSGVSHFTASATFDDEIVVGKTVTMADSASEVIVNGRMAQPYSSYSMTTDLTVTYTAPTYLRVTALNGASRIIALDHTLFRTGTPKWLRNDDATYTITVNDATLGTIVTLAPATSAHVVFDGSYWRLMQKGT